VVECEAEGPKGLGVSHVWDDSENSFLNFWNSCILLVPC
jgi:hypothetical protein